MKPALTQPRHLRIAHEAISGEMSTAFARPMFRDSDPDHDCKGMNSLLASSFKLGADASIAVGPVGTGAKSDILADLIAFSRSKGVYRGLNLDGTVVSTNDDRNKAYFGKPVLVADILVRAAVSSDDAAGRLSAVATAAVGP